MNEQIGLAHLVQGRFEGLHQVVGQFADESYCIGQQERQVVDGDFTNRRVERGEEFVLGKDLGLAEQVHQRRFAHVGISDECHAHHLTAVLPLRSHLSVDAFEVFAQQGDAVIDDSAVGLNLRLTCTTVRSSTAALAVKV